MWKFLVIANLLQNFIGIRCIENSISDGLKVLFRNVTMNETTITYAGFTVINDVMYTGITLDSKFYDGVENIKYCAKDCVNKLNCSSANYFPDHFSINLYQCQLLNDDKFTGEGEMHDMHGSQYLHFKTQCSDKPCQNEAKCVPNYEANNFTCQCSWPWEGDFCTHRLYGGGPPKEELNFDDGTTANSGKASPSISFVLDSGVIMHHPGRVGKVLSCSGYTCIKQTILPSYMLSNFKKSVGHNFEFRIKMKRNPSKEIAKIFYEENNPGGIMLYFNYTSAEWICSFNFQTENLLYKLNYTEPTPYHWHRFRIVFNSILYFQRDSTIASPASLQTNEPTPNIVPQNAQTDVSFLQGDFYFDEFKYY